MTSEQSLILALDIGGSWFRIALADKGGRILSRRAIPSHAGDSYREGINRIYVAIKELVSEVGLDSVAAIGVAAVGPLDIDAGMMLDPPSLPGWRNAPIRSLIEDEYELPLRIDNDASLAALGEHRYGAGIGMDNLIYITVSTGIGGGVIADGRLLWGNRGLAAEIGHMIIEPAGPRCNCGNKGCLEAMASGTAIARLAVDMLSEGSVSAISNLVAGDLDKVTARIVTEAARSGDPLANEVMNRAGTSLGIGVVNLIHVFAPQMVIIGGGVSGAGDIILEPIREVIAERAMRGFAEGLRLTTPARGDDAGLLGAVALVLDSI
ncbi:ROK family protein [Chloroflexota bacterium]